MAEKQTPHISYIVSLCGIMCGLALALMFCLGMIPGFEYVSPGVAGVLIWVVRERLGVRYGLVSYAAVGLMTLLFTANYEASMMYIFLLGYYPIVRQYIMRLGNAVLRWARPIASVEECNCLEEKQADVPFCDGEIPFVIKPYEIKTFRIREQ